MSEKVNEGMLPPEKRERPDPSVRERLKDVRRRDFLGALAGAAGAFGLGRGAFGRSLGTQAPAAPAPPCRDTHTGTTTYTTTVTTPSGSTTFTVGVNPPVAPPTTVTQTAATSTSYTALGTGTTTFPGISTTTTVGTATTTAGAPPSTITVTTPTTAHTVTTYTGRTSTGITHTVPITQTITISGNGTSGTVTVTNPSGSATVTITKSWWWTQPCYFVALAPVEPPETTVAAVGELPSPEASVTGKAARVTLPFDLRGGPSVRRRGGFDLDLGV